MADEGQKRRSPQKNMGSGRNYRAIRELARTRGRDNTCKRPWKGRGTKYSYGQKNVLILEAHSVNGKATQS